MLHKPHVRFLRKKNKISNYWFKYWFRRVLANISDSRPRLRPLYFRDQDVGRALPHPVSLCAVTLQQTRELEDRWGHLTVRDAMESTQPLKEVQSQGLRRRQEESLIKHHLNIRCEGQRCRTSCWGENQVQTPHGWGGLHAMAGMDIMNSVSGLIRVLVTFSDSRPLIMALTCWGWRCMRSPASSGVQAMHWHRQWTINMKIGVSWGWEAWWATREGCGRLHR